MVKGNTVGAHVGGNQVIASLQDKSTYAQSSQNSSASVSIGVGTASGASLGAGSSKINSNFQNIQEQSGELVIILSHSKAVMAAHPVNYHVLKKLGL